MHAWMHMYTYKNTLAHAHTHTDTLTHKYTNTDTHTHTHNAWMTNILTRTYVALT